MACGKSLCTVQPAPSIGVIGFIAYNAPQVTVHRSLDRYCATGTTVLWVLVSIGTYRFELLSYR